jgi:Ring finger domain
MQLNMRTWLILLWCGVKASEANISSADLVYVEENRTLVQVGDKTNYFPVKLAYGSIASKENQNMTSSSDNIPPTKPVIRLLLPPVATDRTLCSTLPSDLSTLLPRSSTSQVPTGLLIDTDINDNCMFESVVSNILQLNQLIPEAFSIKYLLLIDYKNITYNNKDVIQASSDIVSMLKETDLALIYLQVSDVDRIMTSFGSYYRQRSFISNSYSPFLLDYGSWNWNLLYELEKEGFTYELKYPNLYKFGLINLISVCCVGFGCFCCLYLRRLERRSLFGESDESQQQIGSGALIEAKAKTSLLTVVEFNRLPILKYQVDLAEWLKNEPLESILTRNENYNDKHQDRDISSSKLESYLENSDENLPVINHDEDEIHLVPFVLEGKNDKNDLESQLESSPLQVSGDHHSSNLIENIDKSENQSNIIVEYDEVSKSKTNVAQSCKAEDMPVKKSFDCTPVSPEASFEHSDGCLEDEKKHEVRLQNNLESHIDFDSEDSNACCPICLEDFAETEYVTVLPACKHFYHVGCIREWLLTKQGCCPLCKVDALFSCTECQGESPPLPLQNGSILMAGHIQSSTSVEI